MYSSNLCFIYIFKEIIFFLHCNRIKILMMSCLFYISISSASFLLSNRIQLFVYLLIHSIMGDSAHILVNTVVICTLYCFNQVIQACMYLFIYLIITCT